MESYIQIRFVKEVYGYSSIREKELEHSERRAHAARVAHRRPKATKNVFHSNDHFNPLTQIARLRSFSVKRVRSSKPETNEKCSGKQIAESSHQEEPHHAGNLALLAEQQRGGTLLNSAFKGDSDPFQSRGVVITAQINRVITFIRDVALPSFYFTRYLRSCTLGDQREPSVVESSSVISSRAAASHWRQIITNLDHEGTAVACIAAFLALSSRVTGEQTQSLDKAAALRMRVKSSALLRDVLHNRSEGLAVAKSVVLQMFWLFCAETYADNLEAATIHGTMMWKLIKNGMASGCVDVRMLVQILFVDVDLAVKHMRRPLFPIDFCTRRLQPVWDRACQIIPPQYFVNAAKVQECVDFEPLRDIMIADRVCRTLPYHPLPAEEVLDGSSSDIIFAFVASRTLIDNGRLLNYYVELQDGTTEAIQALSDGVRYTRAAMTLAMLYSMRSVGHVSNTQGVNIREAPHLAIICMNNAISKALHTSTAKEMQYYQNAHLWVLFLGALYVQDQSLSRSSSARFDELCFTELLALECRKAGVDTWSQMRAILTEFSYSDMLRPHGSLWFEDILQTERASHVD
ncbi:hypothetical protein H2200_011848 [Cladophialophora chaetospira]|uniref:Transcription factor domain-containing protein n=1 Tax=Cladophialophora chaetospira TaxID=386627 RepID=A0AA38WYW7_9EURO|nr:hypothetical protein H2200_011848 [Cladophialophora chaetospira]